MMLVPHITGGSPVISCIMAHSRRASSRRLSSGTQSRNSSTEASVRCVAGPFLAAMPSGVRADPQNLRAAERDVGVEGELLVRGQPQAGVAADEFGQRDLRLELAEVRAQAVVEAFAESQMTFGVRAVRIEV